MMKRFREHMSMEHPKGKPYRGAFVGSEDSAFAVSGEPTTGNKRDASHVENGAPSAPGEGSRGHTRRKHTPGQRAYGQRAPSHRATSKQPFKEGTATADGARCPACEQPHQLKDCYYVFGENAPQWWHPNPSIVKLVKISMEHDADLQNQVRACKRSRTRTPAVKTSYTPEISLE
jgi:hypothetical protein